MVSPVVGASRYQGAAALHVVRSLVLLRYTVCLKSPIDYHNILLAANVIILPVSRMCGNAYHCFPSLCLLTQNAATKRYLCPPTRLLPPFYVTSRDEVNALIAFPRFWYSPLCVLALISNFLKQLLYGATESR